VKQGQKPVTKKDPPLGRLIQQLDKLGAKLDTEDGKKYVLTI
jgi:hypothetical protein